MNKKDDRQLAINNLEKLEKENLIDRREFLTLSSLAASTALFTNFLTMESSFAWVATRMRRGKVSNTSNIDVGDIANSLRFRSSAGAYLSRTFTSSNTQTWTLSFWYKPAALGAYAYVLTAGTSATNYALISFACSGFLDANDTLKIYQVWSNSSASPNYTLLSSAVFRDPSAWYHVVISSDVTVSNGIKAYVNGNQVALSGTQPTAGGSPSWFNSNVTHSIGRNQAYATSTMDAYLSRICLVDGQALTPSSFGYYNSNSNSWVTKSQSAVKAVVDAGGANSFMLDFDNGTSTATLGYDKSAKGNNWTTTNFSLTAGTSYDWMTDTPSNNYCILTPLRQPSVNGTMSQANLRVAGSAGTVNSHAFGSMPIKSKTWFEFKIGTIGTVGGIGLSTAFTTSYTPYNTPTGVYYLMTGNKRVTGTNSAYGATFTTNDVIGVAVNPTAETVEFFKQTGGAGAFVSQGVITATGLFSSSDMFPHGGFDDAGSPVVYFNFGQQPFNNSSIPSGFAALCTRNLPVPTIVNSKKHFDVALYTGNAAARSITTDGSGNNLQLAPDLVWAKARTGGANNHVLFDSVRGVGNYIMSSSALAEVYNANMLTAFNSNGFSVSTDSTTAINGNGLSIVSWLWKAGGAAVANNAGNIASSVSANVTSGFSIVTWTGNGAASSGVTIGHGLGKKPDFIMVKKRSSGTTDYGWSCWHKDLGGNYGIWLHVTNARNTTMWGGYTNHSATVFSPPDQLYSNENGHTYVTYCFTEIAGFSKIGSYTGNGSADGPFVYCGFRPRWLLVKRSDSTGSWIIYDSLRDTYNTMGTEIIAEGAGAETTGGPVFYDFTANGFKVRHAVGQYNASGGTYIFAAFAEAPFKYANAR